MNLSDIDVQAVEQALTTGSWGCFDAVAQRVTPWYEAAQVPRELILGAAVHPLAEYIAEFRHLGKELDDFIVDPSRALGPAQRLFADEGHPRSQPARHEADEWLERVVDDRLAEGVTRLETNYDELDAGMRRLRDLVPVLAADVTRYLMRAIRTSDRSYVALTWTDLGGLVVVGRDAYVDAFKAAESLLHEALHSKSERLSRGFTQTYLPWSDDDPGDLVVMIPWRRGPVGEPVLWSLSRVFDAYYVYAHLTVLHAAHHASRPGPDRRHGLRRVCFRAAYLSRQLTRHRADFDADRIRLREWLDTWRVPAFDLNAAGRALV